MKFLDNPLKWYVGKIKNSIEPTNPTHKISMSVEIPKGQTEGRALVPCAIYTMDHTIDTNPALVRRKDKRVVKKYPVNKKIKYDPKKYDLILTEDEKKKGYELVEIERCSHCGLKTVIAEVAETRYRSCPDIKVRVSDPAKENLVIPVDFGVRKNQILLGIFIPFILDIMIVYLFFSVFFGFNFLNNLSIKLISSFSSLGYLVIGVGFLFLLHIAILAHYKGYKLFKWYSVTKPTLREVKNYKKRG